MWSAVKRRTISAVAKNPWFVVQYKPMPTLSRRAKRSSASPWELPVSSGTQTIMTPLTAFAVRPDGIKFETQEKNEEVILFLRQHVIILVPTAFLVIVLALAPLIFLPFIFRFLTIPFTIPPQYYIVGTAFWYVMTLGVALMGFLRWYFNIYILTNRRIVDIDFIHLLYKEFSEARLDKIQDINFRSGGIFATFINFGDVFVQTAGETPNIDFLAVPQPAKVVETISKLAEESRSGGTV